MHYTCVTLCIIYYYGTTSIIKVDKIMCGTLLENKLEILKLLNTVLKFGDTAQRKHQIKIN